MEMNFPSALYFWLRFVMGSRISKPITVYFDGVLDAPEELDTGGAVVGDGDVFENVCDSEKSGVTFVNVTVFVAPPPRPKPIVGPPPITTSPAVKSTASNMSRDALGPAATFIWFKTSFGPSA
jgi:hypothetical protein